MSIEVARYETWKTVDPIEYIDPQSTFLLDTFFPRVKLTKERMIEWDIVEGGRRIAPYVSPLVQGKPTRRLGHRSYNLSPAYIKLNDVLTPTEAFTRLPGEEYGGSVSLERRIIELEAQAIKLHDNMITTRLEQMAAECLINAKLIVEPEEHPKIEVDFERPSDLTVNLSGAAAWDQNTSDPLTDIEALSRLSNRMNRGGNINKLIMTSVTYDVLQRHQDFRDLLKKDLNLSPGTKGFDLGPSNDRKATKKGILAGKWEIWTYDEHYEDDTAGAVPFLPDDKILFVNTDQKTGLNGTQFYGPLSDYDALAMAEERDMPTLKRHMKIKNRFDPSAIEVVTQSSPMLAIKRPNATATLTIR